MGQRLSRGAWIGGLLLLAGCTGTRPPAAPSATGDTSWRLVAPEGTRRYELALGEVASGATPVQRVRPVYPPSELPACPPPVEIRALLIVDEHGRVTEVRTAGAAQDDPGLQPFAAAVRTAALQWTFTPLLKEHWAADAQGNSHVVDTRTLPFSLTYAFRFQCSHGRGMVSAGTRAASG